MATDLSSMRTGIRYRLGVPSNDEFFSDTQLDNLVNEALQAVSTENLWPWLGTSTTFDTVAGTGTYSVPSGWTQTKALFISGYEPMTPIPLADANAITYSSQPAFYCVFGDQILLRGVPGAVYTVTHQYYKVEPVLSSSAATPLMPAQFRDSIVEYAVYLASLRASDESRLTTALQGYKMWLERMSAYKRRTTAPTPIRVRPGRDF